MGIVGGLITLRTLAEWAVDFSEVVAADCCSEGETPTAAIDGNCWIYECACGIVAGLESGCPGAFNRLLFAFKKRIDYVRKCGWDTIIVFDGRSLPIKKATNDKRAARRSKAKKHKQNKGKRGVGSDLSGFKVTHDLIHRLVLSLQTFGETVLVAPHEGDSQCAFLVNNGKAHIVITRDSDLIPHGCRCIFFWNSTYKCAMPGGFGGKFYYKPSLWRCQQGLWNPILQLGWDSFLAVCVLAGCDYNVGVKNVGIKKAIQLMTKHRTLEAVVELLLDPQRQHYKNAKVPDDFLVSAHKSMVMFKHALVFDPDRNVVLHAQDLPAGESPLIQIGSPNWMGRVPISREQAIGLSRSEIHPETLVPYPPLTREVVSRSTDTSATVPRDPHKSRSGRRFKPTKRKREQDQSGGRRKIEKVVPLNAVQWKRLLQENNINVDVPQVHTQSRVRVVYFIFK